MIELHVIIHDKSAYEHYNRYNNLYTKNFKLIPLIRNENTVDYGIECKMYVNDIPNDYLLLLENSYNGKFTYDKTNSLKITFDTTPPPDLSIYSGIPEKDNTCKPFVVKITI